MNSWMNALNNYGWINKFFEGEGAGDGGNNPPPNPNPNQNPPNPNPDDKKYSQADVNRMMAENKRTLQSQNRQLVQDLETLKENKNLSDQEKESLQTRIDELNSQFQTKEQTLKSQYEDLQKKYERDLKKSTEQGDFWKTQYETQLKNTDILNAAVKYKAVNPTQIQALLDSKTKVVEQLDSESKPTGKFAPRVTMEVERDGKMIEMNFTVDEAVKAMTEMPDFYGNLFKSEANGGIGGNTNNNSKRQGLPALTSETSMETYIKNRDKYLAAAK